MLEDRRSPLVVPLRDTNERCDMTNETRSGFSPSSLTLADLLSPEAHCKRDEPSRTRMNVVEGLAESSISPGKKRPSLHQRALLSSSPLNYFHGNSLELNSNLSRVTTLMLSSPQLSSPSEAKTAEHQIMGYDTEKEEDTFYIGDDESSSSIVSAPPETNPVDGKREYHEVINREDAQREQSTWFPPVIAPSRHRDVEMSIPSSPLAIRKRRATIDTPSLAETNSCLEQRLRLSDSPTKTYKAHNVGISNETEWGRRQPRLLPTR
jgi:hypothetical protein